MAYRRTCPEKQDCLLVRSGNCPHAHPPCRHGVDCHFLKKRNCSYYHPRIHFAIVAAADDEDDDEGDTNDEGDKEKHDGRVDPKPALQKDDDSVINAIHPITPPIRHNKPWQKWEDEKLVKYINTSKNTKDPKYLSKFTKEFQRKETSILARIQKIKATKKNKEAQKTNHSETETENSEPHENENGDEDEEDEEDDSETSSSDDDDSDKHIVNTALNNRVQQLMKILNDLKCYWAKASNKYEVRSIDHLIQHINEATFNEEKELHEIIGCDIGYFKDKLNTMRQKYGAIDRETQSKTMELLKNVKTLCEDQIKNIENIVSNVADHHWLGDKVEFERITKHDVFYFERIERAMKSPTLKTIKMEVDNELYRQSQKDRDRSAERGRARGVSVDRGQNSHKTHSDRKRHRDYHSNHHYPHAKRTKYVNAI